MNWCCSEMMSTGSRKVFHEFLGCLLGLGDKDKHFNENDAFNQFHPLVCYRFEVNLFKNTL